MSDMHEGAALESGRGVAPLSPPMRPQLELTLDLANETLAVIERDITDLMQRADDWRAFIRLGAAILAGTPVPDDPPPVMVHDDPPPVVPPATMTATQKAHMVLAAEGYAMSLDAIMERLGELGLIEGKQRDALKTALRTHPKVFTHPTSKLYGLVAWSTTDGVKEVR